MNKIINCKEIVAKIKDEVREEVGGLNTQPHLVVIIVGEDKASQTYVANKHKVCEETGIKSTIVRLPENTTQDELETTINTLSTDNDVHGILLQLPLPKHLNDQKAIELIPSYKDVDGLTVANQGLLAVGDLKNAVIPCTPAGVMRILEENGNDLNGAEAVVVGRSNLFGKPMAQLLLNANATVTMCHSRTKDLRKHTNNSSIVICAVGRAKMFDSTYISDGATVVDVGINRDENGKLCGDCHTNDIIENKQNVDITPVPGGVGILTTSMLMKNVIKCYRLQEAK